MLVLKPLLKSLMDLLFPPRCLVCRKLGDKVLCGQCLKQIKFIPYQSGSMHSVGIYEGILQSAIHKFKFKKKKALANPLGKLMASYLNSIPHKIDLIIPVPLHQKRLKQRGFNQSKLLAEVISKELDIPLEATSLMRTKNTKPQFKLKREERLTNMESAFGVRGKSIQGKHILLVDDILTTGVTIRECIKVLEASGARKIEVLTLSKAVV